MAMRKFFLIFFLLIAKKVLLHHKKRQVQDNVLLLMFKAKGLSPSKVNGYFIFALTIFMCETV